MVIRTADRGASELAFAAGAPVARWRKSGRESFMALSLCITRKSEGMGTQLAADSISRAKAGQFPTRLRAHSRCRSKLGPRHVPPGSSTIGLDLLGVVSGQWSVNGR
jgi:hypothetical protein